MTDNYEALRRALAGFPSIDEYHRGGFQASLTRAVNDLLAATDPDTLSALIAERDALAARVRELEADAGRYRWLRKQDSDVAVMVHHIDEGLALDSLDAAIDDARIEEETRAGAARGEHQAPQEDKL